MSLSRPPVEQPVAGLQKFPRPWVEWLLAVWNNLNVAGNPAGPQAAHTVLAGPLTGAPALPEFRGLVEADIPNVDWTKLTGTPTTLAGYGLTDAQPLDGDLTALAALTGTGFLQRTGANAWSLVAAPGVTSVGLSLPGSLFTVSGSPVTATGTLTGALVNHSPHYVFIGPASGPAAPPAFRRLAPDDLADYTASAVWNPASLPDGGQASTTVNVTGAVVSDFVAYVAADAALQGLKLWGEVTAADTVTLYLSNHTGAAVDLPNTTFYVGVLKRA